jgi:hypothetical protein
MNLRPSKTSWCALASVCFTVLAPVIAFAVLLRMSSIGDTEPYGELIYFPDVYALSTAAGVLGALLLLAGMASIASMVRHERFRILATVALCINALTLAAAASAAVAHWCA